MRRWLSIVWLCAALVCALDGGAETLTYDVTFKWGLIHKHAGTATLTLTPEKNGLSRAVLIGRSDGWADKFYSLRDTLVSIFPTTTFAPTLYQRIAHEDGNYAYDIVQFSRNGAHVSAKTTMMRKGKKDKTLTTDNKQLSATGMTVDLLSSFYYLRNLPFETLEPGWKETINIFSGKRKELLSIRYVGVDMVDINGKKVRAHHVKFMFTSDGRNESSTPIDAWVSMDNRRVPLYIEGSLRIGKVRCTLR